MNVVSTNGTRPDSSAAENIEQTAVTTDTAAGETQPATAKRATQKQNAAKPATPVRRRRPATPAATKPKSGDAKPVRRTWPRANARKLRAPENILNRELTWLEFNKRVLDEACDVQSPLLERVKFLSIVSSNLDEFYMKRIGGLKQQVGAGVHLLTADGRTPQEQIDQCCAVIRGIEEQSRSAFKAIEPLLRDNHIEICGYGDLSAEEQSKLREYYFDNLYPLVTPQAMDPAHPFPFISNLSMNLLVALRHQGEAEELLARVKVPVGDGSPRFFRVGEEDRFVALEDIMAHNLDLLFPGMEIIFMDIPGHPERQHRTRRRGSR
jgi:polyphosphate kinase